MLTGCINLKKQFGEQYKVEYEEESYFAERGEGARADDPWLQIILCKHGHIYPQGGVRLGASTNKRGGIARKLARLECTEVLQDSWSGRWRFQSSRI